jgi:multicomponent Na+:H+ antiporter subunit D
VTEPLPLVLLVPFAGGLVTVFLSGRAQALAGCVAALATAGATLLLVWRVLEQGPGVYALGGWAPPLGIVLEADGLAVLMLSLTGMVATMVSLYAPGYFVGSREDDIGPRVFWPLWLLLWGGLNGVFLSRDVFTLYLLLEFTLVASVALAALGGSKAGHVSALRYLLAATTAALFYLAGVGLLYAETGTLDLAWLRDARLSGPLPVIALALMVGALLVKCALFPMHFWLPAAHSTAPAPVSAVLSALVVKTGFYVIVRLWVETMPGIVPLGADAMAALGATAVLWGSWRAVRQDRLKMLVAYSTVAQVGYLFLLMPLAAVARGEVVAAVTYHMVSHGLAKAAMFLGAGALLKAAHSDLLARMRGTGRHAPLAVAALVISGAALAGVVPGAGAKGKMLSITLAHGQWWWAVVIFAGMILAAAYTVVAVRPALSGGSGPPGRFAPAPRSLEVTALVLALAAVALSLTSDAALALLATGDR